MPDPQCGYVSAHAIAGIPEIRCENPIVMRIITDHVTYACGRHAGQWLTAGTVQTVTPIELVPNAEDEDD